MKIITRTVELIDYWIPDEDLPSSIVHKKWSRKKIAEYFREHMQHSTIHEHVYIDKDVFQIDKDEVYEIDIHNRWRRKWNGINNTVINTETVRLG